VMTAPIRINLWELRKLTSKTGALTPGTFINS
jgi:hypothetical protein